MTFFCFHIYDRKYFTFVTLYFFHICYIFFTYDVEFLHLAFLFFTYMAVVTFFTPCDELGSSQQDLGCNERAC